MFSFFTFVLEYSIAEPDDDKDGNNHIENIDPRKRESIAKAVHHCPMDQIHHDDADRKTVEQRLDPIKNTFIIDHLIKAFWRHAHGF